MYTEVNYSEVLAVYFSRKKQSERVKYLQLSIAGESLEQYYTQLLDLDPQISLIQDEINLWQQQGIALLSLDSEFYPQSLKQIADPPLILFYLGNLENLYQMDRFTAVIGSRRADYFGLQFAKDLACKLVKSNCCVISGLAYGVDSAAHQSALTEKGDCPTIAFLGSGLNKIYPSKNKSLAKEILESGGIIFSQFEPDSQPLPHNFLNRNRLIAGISENIIVIQAGEKSGSLATVRYGLEQGKDIWVVPGDINHWRYAGSNRLIQQGAHVFTGVQDLEYLYPNEKQEGGLSKAPNKLGAYSKIAQQIYQYIKREQSCLKEELAGQFGNDSLDRTLLELEIDGYLKLLPGGYYAVA